MDQQTSFHTYPVSIIPLMGFASVMLLIALSMAQAAQDHEIARRLRHEGTIVPVSHILNAIRRNRPGQLLSMTLQTKEHRKVYLVEWADTHGVVWFIQYDAQTGAPLSIQKDASP